MKGESPAFLVFCFLSLETTLSLVSAGCVGAGFQRAFDLSCRMTHIQTLLFSFYGAHWHPSS